MTEVLVGGLSARALADAATAAGYAPLAADLFCDLDLQERCAATRRLGGSLDAGIDPDAPSALERLARGRAPIGFAYASGFEDRPQLLEAVAELWPILGNSASTIRRVKDPLRLAELCRSLAIPHPEIRFDRPGGDGWLAKRAGGSGGSHVGRAGEATYWQEQVPGEPVSALVLANGGAARVLGLSAQWPDPCPGAPFRYGGAVRPAPLDAGTAGSLSRAAERIAQASGLVGLNSVDFLVAADAYWLIEVNPRPGATLDLFRDRDGRLFAEHVAACRGAPLPHDEFRLAPASAAAILYADAPIAVMPAIAWPEWTADRTPPGVAIAQDAPVCTVVAEAETGAAARALLAGRTAALRGLIGGAQCRSA
ncbi:ATP-grasp domain-containing protein [Faunimonas sp. B44]|uniref:ATP-grasp domain-containing protein n=1 Tax=Faunimonas sp. B44 TaxID=3461493 RepID=UPI00404447CD